jgi:hypothetical protein
MGLEMKPGETYSIDPAIAGDMIACGKAEFVSTSTEIQNWLKAYQSSEKLMAKEGIWAYTNAVNMAKKLISAGTEDVSQMEKYEVNLRFTRPVMKGGQRGPAVVGEVSKMPLSEIPEFLLSGSAELVGEDSDELLGFVITWEPARKYMEGKYQYAFDVLKKQLSKSLQVAA